jgi:hypothetical protein
MAGGISNSKPVDISDINQNYLNTRSIAAKRIAAKRAEAAEMESQVEVCDTIYSVALTTGICSDASLDLGVATERLARMAGEV